MSENKEIEVIDKELETGPEMGGIVEVPTKAGIDDLVYLGDNIDRIINAQNKIRVAVLKLAQPGDWVTFGSGENKKAEIGFAGALRIGSTLGVSFTNWSATKENGTDEIGSWFRWEYECDAVFRGRTIRVYGRAGSRDKFFGKEHGEFKPVHEVDEGNIKMAARRAAMKEGVKVLFGMHHMDTKYLETHGVTLAHAGGYDFKSKEQEVQDTLAVTVALTEATISKQGKNKKGQDWTLYSVKSGEGDQFFTFSLTAYQAAREAISKKVLANIFYKKNERGSNEITAISLTDAVTL